MVHQKRRSTERIQPLSHRTFLSSDALGLGAAQILIFTGFSFIPPVQPPYSDVDLCTRVQGKLNKLDDTKTLTCHWRRLMVHVKVHPLQKYHL